jgi:tetratricopeptide (TPR) repeat protein/DNA-binding XRE family transcriptional regulator
MQPREPNSRTYISLCHTFEERTSGIPPLRKHDMPRPVELHPSISPLHPNWRLKAARERLRWSQQDLADQLKITPNTVSRWERGLNVPSPYFRRRLCELFGLSAEDLGLFPDQDGAKQALIGSSSCIITPEIWSVPFVRNPLFTGREQTLERLHARLRGGQQISRLPQALCGLAGVGKTQTAIEYCYRYAEEYQALLWLRAETEETLLADLLAMADLLGLHEREQREPQRIVEAVKAWLRTHRDWLLVLDNLEDLSLLQHVASCIHRGHVLLTMRAQTTGTLAQSFEVRKMEEPEAALFLLRRAKYLTADASLEDASAADRDSALEIARLLDGLPLALDQAGAYIEETACSLTDYLDHYYRRRAPLLDRRSRSASNHPASVTATLSLMIERVEIRHAPAADLLRLCSFLQPDAIPEGLILDGAPALGSPLALLARDASAFDAAIKMLRTFSLIQRHPTSKTLSLHRLVQAVVQDQLVEPEQRQWAERAVALVGHALPPATDDVNWPRRQRYLPQALACVALIERWQLISYEAGRLLLRTGYCLLERSQYVGAEKLLLRARDILLRTVGEQHSDYAYSLNNLALSYHYQGRYEEAESLYRQSLRIREELFGHEHYTIAQSLHNLGGLYYDRGHYAQAEAFVQRALPILQKLFGPEDLLSLHLLNNLGFIYIRRGTYTQAEPLLQRVVDLREKRLGIEHPDTLISLFLLANLYAARKQYEQAEALHQQVLVLREKHLGSQHDNVGDSLHSLAQLYHEQGQCNEAEKYYRRALTVYEHTLGSRHPSTAQVLNNLARLLLEQGRITEGEELCRHALTIQERALGTRHPDYAESLATLALLYEKQGDNIRALQFYQRALALCEGILEPEHPLFARCRAGCSRLLPGAARQQPATTEEVPTSAQKHASESSGSGEQTGGEDEQRAVLDAFLAARCQVHPRAWCQASDLWHAYQRWCQRQEGCQPLTRRAFAEALRASGFQPDRTSAARIWRGITLLPLTEATEQKK